MQEKAAKIKKGGEGCANVSIKEHSAVPESCYSMLASSARIVTVYIIMCLSHRHQSAQAECEGALIHLQYLPHSFPLHDK